MTKKAAKKRKGGKEVILLQDLAPRKEIAGGSCQILFGQAIHPSGDTPKKGRSQT